MPKAVTKPKIRKMPNIPCDSDENFERAVHSQGDACWALLPLSERPQDFMTEKLFARLTDIEIIGALEKRREYFVTVCLEEEEAVKLRKKHGVSPLRWQEYHRITFCPSSTMKIALFHRSGFPLRRPYQIGQYTCSVTHLLENNATLDFTDDTRSQLLCGLKIKLSLISEPARDFMRSVDANVSRLNNNQMLASDLGPVDAAASVAQAGSHGTKYLGSCVVPLGQALQIFVTVMDKFEDAHPILKVSWTILSAVYKTVQEQQRQDEDILALTESLREMIGVATEFSTILVVEGTTDVIEQIGRASLQVASLIDEYTRLPFTRRMLKFQITDEMKFRIAECEKICRDLIEKYDRRVMMGMSREIGEQGAMVRNVRETLDTIKNNDLSEKIFMWLKAPESSANYHAARKKHHEGTGSWFTTGEFFSRWKQGRHPFICIYGKPGCGKTILCSSIVSHVADMCEARGSDACAYFFFDGRDAQSALQLHESLIRSLIQQFVDQCDGIPSPLVKVYGNGHQQPSTDSLEETLLIILRRFTTAYIIIDSLDECADRRELLKWINDITRSNAGNLCLLVTSRPEWDIRDCLRPLEPACISMDGELINRDINAYVDFGINEGRLKRWPEMVRSQIKTKLMERADGMFRWLAIQLDELQRCLDQDELYDQLERLPSDLDETYQRALARIPEQRRARVKIFLQWTAFSARPPTLRELAEAGAVDFDQQNFPKYNPGRKFEPQDILAACASLIIDSDGHVKLAHFTVKEYLTSDRITNGAVSYFSISERLSHSLIAQSCLAYLLRFDSEEPLDEETLTDYPLAEYAAEAWVLHVRRGGEEDSTTQNLIIKLLESAAGLTNWIRLWDPDEPWKEGHNFHLPVENIAHPLYYTTLLGLMEPSRRLLQNGLNAGRSNTIRETRGVYGESFRAAPEWGHTGLMRLRIDRGVDVSTITIHGMALIAASGNGHSGVARLLIDSGADVNVVLNRDTALAAASRHGHLTVAKLLIDHGADVNAMAGRDTALTATSEWGHIEVMKLLLDSGANVNVVAGYYGTALTAAAEWGRMEVVKLLIDRGADVNAAARNYDTALAAASRHGNLELAELFLEHGADVNAVAGEYGTALTAASRSGNVELVKLLLDSGADVNTVAGKYGTALAAASKRGQMEVMNLLIDRGVDINVVAGKDGTALAAASRSGHLELVALLIDRGVDISVVAGKYGTALTAASRSGNLELVKLLLNYGADVNGVAGQYSTALQAALDMGRPDLVKLLLEHGATQPPEIQMAFQ